MYKRNFYFYFVVFECVFCLYSTVLAQELPVQQNYIEDKVNMVNDTVESSLNSDLLELEQKTGTQMVVLTIDTTNRIDIETYALALATMLKLGQEGENNGVLIVIAKDDCAYRIEVGHGLEEILPDSFCGSVGRSYFVSYFQKGQFSEGIYKGISALVQKVAEGYGVRVSSNIKTHKQLQKNIIPTILRVYEEHGIQKEVDISFRPEYGIEIMPRNKGRVYARDEDDNKENLIADIEVISITRDGVAHAKRTKGSNTIKIKKGDTVRFELGTTPEKPKKKFNINQAIKLIEKAKEADVKVTDASNLKQIGLGIFMYMNDHNGKLPDNLAALIKEEYISSINVFHSPASDKDVSIEMLEQNKGDYVYFGKGRSEAFFSGGDNPFAVTRPGLFPGNFVNILFSDGHVEACKDYHDNPVLMNLLGDERE